MRARSADGKGKLHWGCALFEPAFVKRRSKLRTETPTEAAVGEGTTGALDNLLQQPHTVTLYPTTVESATRSVIREVLIAIRVDSSLVYS
jgi:hypothetical protein